MICEHCFGEITDTWISDMPKPGQSDDRVPYWHMNVKECREASTRTTKVTRYWDGK